ncbi:hypothetical protein [Paenibacillus nanensis]|uniref:hypothetical protein n=1 Tax=Paenibacillus nanensis TaxID=393251 RepID=UPI0011C358B7|nr:hypothetical protein [Paenibacillus nanensis]
MKNTVAGWDGAGWAAVTAKNTIARRKDAVEVAVTVEKTVAGWDGGGWVAVMAKNTIAGRKDAVGVAVTA